MSNWTVTLEDQDPEGLMPTHWWTVRLEYAPRTDPERPGGSWTMVTPGTHWARILETAMTNLTEEQIYALVDANS